MCYLGPFNLEFADEILYEGLRQVLSALYKQKRYFLSDVSDDDVSSWVLRCSLSYVGIVN